jgi:quercetin dioxygenase-like cupin family protein
MQVKVRAEDGWRSPWSAAEPLKIGYAFAGAAEGWRQDGPNVARRDLGLAAASGGLMHAEHRRGLGAEAAAAPQRHDLDFQFLYVLKGAVTIESDAGGRHTLRAGSAALHSRLPRYAESGHSADFEVIEITAPAPGNEKSRAGATPRARYLHLTPKSFVVGAGPRRYFAYRDLETADFTERRIHLHVVKAMEPMPGGTGWHNHTMSQLFVVLQGWAVLRVEGQGERKMHAGDAMCLTAGMRHDVPAYSADYQVLEMCVPADYDTTATPAPAGA